jgi:phosphoglycerol transferase MdoB-like AlkP superfamily enzyme
VKYTDWAIGEFARKAASRPWFKETLFVVVADHCASAAGQTRLPLNRYHIPMIFYAPGLLKPGRYDRIASQIDLAPTLLDLLGKAGDDLFFGESLFEHSESPPRAFVSNFQELGYYKNGLLTVLRPLGKVETQTIDPVTLAGTPARLDPVLLEEAIAYYQTAARAFKEGCLISPDHRNPPVVIR